MKLKEEDDIDVIYDFGEEHKFRIIVKEVKSEASTEVKVVEQKGVAPSQYGVEEEEDEEVEEEDVESEEEEPSDECTNSCYADGNVDDESDEDEQSD